MSVRLRDPNGTVRDVPDDQVDRAIATGFKPLDAGEGAAFETTPEAKTGIIDKAQAGLGAALSTASGGLTDVVIDQLGTRSERDYHRQVRADNEGSALAGTLLGAVVDPFGAGSLATKAGARLAGVEKSAGSIARAAGATAIEGGIQGVGQTVGELALSDHPLTAEHIASTLSTNVLLGAGIGGVTGGLFKVGEKALTRAGAALEKASTARTAIEGVPADLAHLDDAGLRQAAQAAKAEHAADAVAERQSLEALRVEQRAELANQVRDFHTELATERPIFSAVAGADVRAIPGVGTEVASPLNKAYRSLRAAFDNPIAIAENPTSLLKPLQMQQTALENLQARMPEIQAVLGSDPRAAALEHVTGALEQNKAFQSAIRQLDRQTPVSGTRLAMLEAGPSARMTAIDGAREALKNAPELGLVGKGAKGAAFAGVTALANMIPGVGVMAPFLGKNASDMVGKLFGDLSKNGATVAQRSREMAKVFLGAAEKAAPAMRSTATRVLSAARYGNEEPKSQSLPDLFHARSKELRQLTHYAADGSVQMRPEARIALAKQLAPIAAVNPLLADKIETIKARGIAFASSKIPRRPEVGGLQIGPDTWRPSDLAIRSFARTIRAIEDPDGVEERLADGTITPEDAEAYRHVFPERFAAMQQAIFDAAPTLSKTLPMKKKIALSIFTGVPLIPALQPNVLAVLQGNFATEPGSEGGNQAPAAEPRFGALGSLKSSDKPTPSQQREGT